MNQVQETAIDRMWERACLIYAKRYGKLPYDPKSANGRLALLHHSRVWEWPEWKTQNATETALLQIPKDWKPKKPVKDEPENVDVGPCRAAPGTNEKIKVLAARCHDGLELFRSDDYRFD